MSFQICKLCIFSFDFILAQCTCIVVPTHTLSYLYLFIRCHKFTSVLSYLHIHCHFLSVRQCHIQLSFVLSAVTLSCIYCHFYPNIVILYIVLPCHSYPNFVIVIVCFVISTHSLSLIAHLSSHILYGRFYILLFVFSTSTALCHLYLMLCHFYPYTVLYNSVAYSFLPVLCHVPIPLAL